MKTKFFAMVLVTSILLTSLFGTVPMLSSTSQAVTLPTPAYEWTFDGDSVDGTTVRNIQNAGSTSDSAILLGGASVQQNSERASNVLNLPGGSAGSGSLKLPENLYAEASSGFTMSMWIKADASASHYSRVLESSNGTLGSAYMGHSNSWQDTEFTFVVGGSDTAATRYNSAIQIGEENIAATTRSKLIWDTTLEKAKWQHVSISVSPSSYDVYLNGTKVSTTENNDSGASTNATLQEALAKFFDPAFLASLKYSSIGQCVYTSDNDLKAQIDEVRFYNQALTAEEANAVFSSYKVVTADLEAEITKARAVSPSLFTRASYEEVMKQIAIAQAVAADPVSAANVQNAITALDDKLGALVEFTGTESEKDPNLKYEYTFSNVEGSNVINEVDATSGAAIIGDAASIVVDIDKGNVLSLPGRTYTSGVNIDSGEDGILTLPSDMFSTVTSDNGFTVSMMVNAASDQNEYSSFFTASSNQLGLNDLGTGGDSWWTDPELSLLAGNSDAASSSEYARGTRIYAGVKANGSGESLASIQHKTVESDKWQLLTLTIDEDNYAVYIDGEKVADNSSTVLNGNSTIANAIARLFVVDDNGETDISKFTNIALGKGIYRNPNLKAEIDNFQFYSKALTQDEVTELATEEADRRQLDAELASAKALSANDYSNESYAELTLAISDVEGISSDANQDIIDEALLSLRSAVDGLAHKVDVAVQPAYMYTFEDGITNGKVTNEVTQTDDAAIKNNAVIVQDSQRGNVLSLPGGTNGTAGSLYLPSNLFEGVTADKGFTVSMWTYIYPDCAYWGRLFDAGMGDYGTGSAKSNIFISSRGATDLYTPSGNKNMSDAVIDVGKWTQVTFSVNGTQQILYINGVPVKEDDSNAAIFEDISSFVYNSIGQSRYSADNDAKELVDDFMFFKRTLTSDEAIALSGEENVSGAASILVTGKSNVLTVAPGQFSLKYDIGNELTVYTKEQIIVTPSATGAQVNVSETASSNVFDITVTSPNGKNTTKYTLTLLNLSDGAVMNFDVTKSTGPIMHGASGFLYGVSEPNVPTIDLFSPLKPQILVQKAKDGKQHPTGDATRLTSMLKESGAKQIQVYLQDYYLEWPYESNGIDDYKQKVISIINDMKAANNGDLSDYSFVLFNEPDGIWYNNNVTKFNQDWLTIYTTVKAIDNDIKVAGPNISGYSESWMDSFLKFCSENNCLPEIISWHELYDGADKGNSLISYKEHYSYTQGLIDTYYTANNIAKPMVVINEYALFENIGTAGSLVKWLSMFEETKSYACLAYWGLANSLNELAAEANKPNSAWWLYKWYGDMQGDTVQVTTSNVTDKGTYGLTTVDETNKTIKTIFGGQDGTQTAYINNLTGLEGFEGATSAHVKLYSTAYTGQQGFEDDIPVEFEGNLALANGSLKIQVNDCNALDAYYAVITPATGTNVTTIADYNRNWAATYEAENAKLIGNATAFTKSGGSDLARSNRAEVGSINSSNDGVEFAVDVPKDGKYKLQIYYSSQAPNVDPITLEVKASGQNRAIGQLMQHQLTVDGTDSQLVTYESTVKWGYYKYATVYIDLIKGSHTLTLKHYGEDQSTKSLGIQIAAILDKIDLTYDSAIGGEKSTPSAVVKLEEVLGTSSYKFDQKTSGYSSGGYASGKGSLPLTVVVPEDGLYDTSLVYHAASQGTVNIKKQEVDYPKDAVSTSPIKTRQADITNFNTNTGALWTTKDCGKIYLTAGANTIMLSSNVNVDFDKISFVKNEAATKSQTISVEAEDCELEGNAKVITNNYASNSKMVDGISIGQNPAAGEDANASRLTLKVNVQKAGNYKLSMVYTNDEPAPVMVKANGDNFVHPYNTDLVERYAQVLVNGAEAETVYYRNTLSWDMLRNVVIDVNLVEGDNTIVIYNDNSYHFSSIVNSSAPRFDKFLITPAYIASTEDSTDIPLTGISLNTTSTSLKKGKTMSLVISPVPTDSTDSIAAYWQSSNENVATVDQVGKVTAVKVGTATITATVGSFLASCEVTVTKNSSSSGGSSGSDSTNTGGGTSGEEDTSANTDEDTSNTTKPIEKTFNDMDKHQWAVEAVETLAAEGIISGTSATTFEPGRNISRADFLTLLVKALKLKADFTDNFADVSSAAYYYNAVGIAKQLGITSGAGNNEFNPKAEISRQDMMVLVVKALKIAGIELEAGTTADIAGFKDSSNVSGYASAAVATLIKYGIITGSENAINPKFQLTRAEAAVVIYKIYKK